MRALSGRWKPLWLLLVCLVVAEPLTPSLALSGDEISVKNVRYETSGNRIVVTYDLVGPPDREYVIKVTLKRRQTASFEYVPKAVSGDVGQGNFCGYGRQIVWYILQDYPNGLEGEDYYFKVEATMISPGSNLLYYIGGGGVVVGAAVLYLLKNKQQSAGEGSFPQPVGRPAGY